MAVICASARFLLPLFSLGYPETATILISHTLPSPRTLIALLARGIGEIKGLTSEQKIDVLTSKGSKQVEARLILQWAFESNSYAFSRPLSPIMKSSQIWRVVWIEKEFLIKKKKEEKREVPRDAINVEIVSLAEIAAYLFLHLDGVNESLRKYLGGYLSQVDDVTKRDIERALQIARVIGRSEMLATPISVEVFNSFNIIGSEGKINTYCPLNWLKEVVQQGLMEDVLIHLRLLPDEDKDLTDLPEHRRKKLKFVLPLSLERFIQDKKIVEYLKPIEVDVKVKDEYTIIELPDRGRVVLPKDFLGVK
ncbi:MAG: hypothetical protein NDP13_01270 [Crenarchaeota archaeon]|nr:hypothetical protein [Thermoproteota archaeon]